MQGLPGKVKVILTSDQLQRRVRDIARQISNEYEGKTITAVCVMDNGFVFMADLIRHLELSVVSRFIKPELTERKEGSVTATQILYAPEIDVTGQHVLLVEALLQSGVTTEFLIRNLLSRGALSVKVVAMLDRQSQRRVFLQPDFFGFIVDENFLVGYGLGYSDLGRNLPYVAALPEPPPEKA